MEEPRDGIERRAVTQRADEAVGKDARARDVRRIDLRDDQDLAHLHFGRRIRPVDANEVEAERRLDDLRDLTLLDRERAEHVALELDGKIAALAPAQISTEILRRGVHGLALGHALEVHAAFDLAAE